MINEFKENAIINMTLNQYIENLLIDEENQKLWGIGHLNTLDREELAEEYTSFVLESNGDLIIGGKQNIQEFVEYIAHQIDRKIPKFYFLKCNSNISKTYSTLLTCRIYQTKGKDGFIYTKGLKYKYEHDFSKDKLFIERTKATEKQINCLRLLGEENGFLLYREEFLSKAYATTLIDYLIGRKMREPTVFFYFFSIQ